MEKFFTCVDRAQARAYVQNWLQPVWIRTMEFALLLYLLEESFEAEGHSVVFDDDDDDEKPVRPAQIWIIKNKLLPLPVDLDHEASAI